MQVTTMTGRERVLQTMACLPTDRVPWVPFVGCHAGALVQATATEYFHSVDHMVTGMARAIQRYQPDGIPVTFDLQIEAEALGCELVWSDENPPAVISHPLANGTSLESLTVPGPHAARIPLVLEAARRIRANHPDLALYGLITGPFTLALHLLGTDIFMRMFDDPAGVHQLLAFCRDVGLAMTDYYLNAGCDVVAMVDPMTSQIGPDQFRQFVSPYATPIFEHIRQNHAKGSFFVCGHAEQNIEAMCECTPDNVSIDENIPLEYVRDVCLARQISFGGNMQLTSVLLLGDEMDSQKNAVACLDMGGEKGFILAPGCDLPYATPPANLEAVIQVVLDPYQRDVVKTVASTREQQSLLNMKDYGQYRKVIVDIITLDSEACAPCQYMVDSVRKIAPEFEGIVEWREHKIKQRESLVFMTSLMVRNIPTICIDGRITFVSRIPPREELIAAIQQRINEKFRMNIQEHKATLYVLAEDNDESRKLRNNIQQAIMELGTDVMVEQLGDPQEWAAYGTAPNQVPAVVMAHYQTKSTRSVPEVAAIKEWIKHL